MTMQEHMENANLCQGMYTGASPYSSAISTFFTASSVFYTDPDHCSVIVSSLILALKGGMPTVVNHKPGVNYIYPIASSFVVRSHGQILSTQSDTWQIFKGIMINCMMDTKTRDKVSTGTL